MIKPFSVIATRFVDLKTCIDQTVRLFCACDRGSIFINFGVVVVPLIAMVGLGVDVGRGYVVKARLSQALDASALAAAPYADDVVRLQAEFTKYFDANFPSDFMGVNITLAPPVISDNGTKVTVSASAILDTTLMSVLGEDTMSVAASAEVTRLITPLDVVISIDTTGSMGSSDGSGTRLSSAKDAADILVGKLFGNETESDNLQVGLVPWSAAVNVAERGVTYDPGLNTFVDGHWYTNNSPVPFITEPDNDWVGCAYARYTDNSNDDDADHLLYDADVGGTVWEAWEPMPRRVVNPSDGYLYTVRCPEWGISKLSGTKSHATDAIEELSDPTGTTTIAQGLVWAWRTLMPGEPYNQASDKSNLRRAIVIMTDGLNTSSYRDAYKGDLNVTEMNARLSAVAAQIKATGVDIYVVEYHVETSLMKSVASATTAPYYFKADSAAELEKAFEKIGTELSELRISK
ncbi:pilus assembly protein TadG-related protein [Kiloniella majae]|uniref:pilus assembly protein TadG-related protein n=1 Tax=Kiloniella majae TaxID=1938558 RepID=UPI000A27969A|nr:pilus assembly protein TadG-related protein [Kiloniella majae]